MNLFEKIWMKNFKAGKEKLEKLSDDVGGLKGIFSWKRFDKDGKFINEHVENNSITNISKSSVIRLLAQNVPSYRTTMVPAQYALSRMRFGNDVFLNHNSSDDKTFAYYDPNEISSRDNATVWTGATANPYSSAGGRANQGQTNGGAIQAESGSTVFRAFNVATTFGTNWGADKLFLITLTNAVNFPNLVNLRPPSHKTFKIHFYTAAPNQSNPTANRFLTINYNAVYSRDPVGNAATSVTFQTPPGPAPGTWVNISESNIVWEAANNIWIVKFKTGTGTGGVNFSTITHIVVEFEIGKYNIINSIVPKTGFNSGSGGLSTRFPGGIDYYTINTSQTSYSNSPIGYAIDDYAATFTVVMNTTEGNGVSGDDRPVVYTEAFLFNGLDDLFSIIRFQAPTGYAPAGETPGNGFIKNSQSAYLLSWSIKAVL